MTKAELATLLAFVGPILAAVGAALLAYDAFQGPLRLQVQKTLTSQAEHIRALYKRLATTYPSPPYTAQEVAAARAALERECAEKLIKLENENPLSETRHRHLVADLALWGFLLVLGGSLAQAFSALLSMAPSS